MGERTFAHVWPSCGMLSLERFVIADQLYSVIVFKNNLKTYPFDSAINELFFPFLYVLSFSRFFVYNADAFMGFHFCCCSRQVGLEHFI